MFRIGTIFSSWLTRPSQPFVIKSPNERLKITAEFARSIKTVDRKTLLEYATNPRADVPDINYRIISVLELQRREKLEGNLKEDLNSHEVSALLELVKNERDFPIYGTVHSDPKINKFKKENHAFLRAYAATLLEEYGLEHPELVRLLPKLKKALNSILDNLTHDDGFVKQQAKSLESDPTTIYFKNFLKALSVLDPQHSKTLMEQLHITSI